MKRIYYNITDLLVKENNMGYNAEAFFADYLKRHKFTTDYFAYKFLDGVHEFIGVRCDINSRFMEALEKEGYSVFK